MTLACAQGFHRRGLVAVALLLPAGLIWGVPSPGRTQALQPIQPSPAPLSPQPSPVPLSPQPSPVPLSPQPAPAALIPQPSPAALTPQPGAAALNNPELQLAPQTAMPLFEARDLAQERFVLVAAPIGSGERAQLNIYEQVKDTRPCFAVSGQAPAVVDPLLSSFDFTGICSRYIDANGYSLRIGSEDMASHYRFTVLRQKGDTLLMAMPTRAGAGPDLLVARSAGEAAGFLQLTLEPGWKLMRRSFGDRTLGHVYLYRDGWPGEMIAQPAPAPVPIQPALVAAPGAALQPLQPVQPSLPKASSAGLIPSAGPSPAPAAPQGSKGLPAATPGPVPAAANVIAPAAAPASRTAPVGPAAPVPADARLLQAQPPLPVQSPQSGLPAPSPAGAEPASGVQPLPATPVQPAPPASVAPARQPG